MTLIDDFKYDDNDEIEFDVKTTPNMTILTRFNMTTTM